ncbi:MAG: hypothetical protein ACSHWW_06230 [Nonlabens sp.]|uniref:hypothetical protein n=1 Tax=Nonlabens sp. TaxID=1888209 RepID=UPI003EF7DFB1
MKKKKLYFFSISWRNYPTWLIIVFTIIICFTYISLRFLAEDTIVDDIIGAVFWLSFYGYFIFQWTCKNAVFYKHADHYSIKINGKKLDFDLKFLSEAWIEDNQLHIRRINRVDSFPLNHLRQEDVDKLMGILKEYEPQEA